MSPIWRNNWVGNRTQHSPTHIGNCAPNGGVRWDGLISIVTPSEETHTQYFSMDYTHPTIYYSGRQLPSFHFALPRA